MQLRHIYNISATLSDLFKTEEMAGASIEEVQIILSLPPSTLFAIDKEFYRQTHNGSLEGFRHNPTIDAVIDGIHFSMKEKANEP